MSNTDTETQAATEETQAAPEAASSPEGQETTETQAQTTAETETQTQTEAKPNGKGKETVAAGKSETETTEEAVKPYWPEDWKARIAGTDDKRNPLRKALEPFNDPAAVFHSYQELRRWRDGGNLVKLPDEKASDEDKSAFLKALGVPEKPDEYFDKIKLDDGVVIGEADKPLADEFAKALHPAGATPEVMSAALNWYYKHQEQQMAELDEADENYRVESTRALKEELGPAYSRLTNAIGSLFDQAPGGTDLNADGGLFARIAGGRTADGKIIGNDPDVLRWMVGLARELRPAATVTESGDQSGKAIDAEIEEIRKVMREDRHRYNSDEKMQSRYRELIDAQQRYQARS